MVVVIDNSYLVPFFLPDEDPAPTESLLRKVVEDDASLITPHLWLNEFGNVLLTCVRRGRLTEEAHSACLKQATLLPIAVQSFPGLLFLDQVNLLAVKHQLSFYDATYLALAIDRNGLLATLDKQLRKAAVAEGVLYGLK